MLNGDGGACTRGNARTLRNQKGTATGVGSGGDGHPAAVRMAATPPEQGAGAGGATSHVSGHPRAAVV